MIRPLLVLLATVTPTATAVAAGPQDDATPDLHPALRRAEPAFEALLSADGDPAVCLEIFSAAARSQMGDDRIKTMLGMFRRDIPGGVTRRVREVDEGRGELILYSAEADIAGVFTLLLEDEPPHGIGLISAQLADGDPVVSGIEDGMSPDAMAAFLDEWVAEQASDDRFSGAVLLAKDGEVVFERAYGLASRRFDVANNIETKFNLGSMNKMFTAVAIAQLVEAGKLSYDAFVTDVLLDYPRPDLVKGVTVHHLLTHTSGMGSFWDAMFKIDWTQLREPRDHLPLFAEDALAFEPGERFSYSNSGFLVLGLVIEKVTGQSYYDYVRENIFAPAGMSNTDSWAMDEPVPNLAIGYTRADSDGHGHDGPLRNNLFLHRARGGPAGGGFSTVRDLMRFGEALLSGKLLPRAAADVLITGKVETGWGEHQRYAYGFMDRRVHGDRVVGHNGGAPGINAELNLFPEEGWTIAVLSNIDGAASRVSGRILEMVGRANE